MPPQAKPNAQDSQYGNQDIVKILASSEFHSAPAELQRQVRERLGISAPAPAPESSDLPIVRQHLPTDYVRPRSPFLRGLNWVLGAAGPDPQYKNKTVLQDLERAGRETAERRWLEDTRDPTRTHAGAAFRQFSPRAVADLAHLLHGQGTAKNAAMTALSFVPQARPIIGAIGVVSGGKEALKPRQPEESQADYIQRVLLGASQVAGSAALGKSGRLRSAKSEMEQRISRASYASGAEPGTPNALRMTIPDIMETVSQRRMKLNTVSDLARAVEATNERFNTQMALAEQPFANETVIPKAAGDALRAAADELPKSAANEASQMRAAARQFDQPMTLRELGREMRQQNKLWGTHGGKTSLELSTAKTRASVAINDILRKSLRDTYVDFIESKYQGNPGIRDMRLRQEQILKLRDMLGEYNRTTGKVEKGQTEKLEAAQAKFKGGPSSADIHGVASQHGVRGYLRLPKGMRRGPETQANRAVKKAFREDIGHRIPRRKLTPLTMKPGVSPSAGPLAPKLIPLDDPTFSNVMSSRTGRHQEVPGESRGAEPEIESLRRGASGKPPIDIKPTADDYTQAYENLGSAGHGKAVEVEAKRIASQRMSLTSDVNTRAQVSDRIAEAKRRTESLKRQAAVAGTKHPEWAERIRAAEAKADAAAKSGGDPEAAKLKELAKPAGDTGHLATATEELFPGRKFHELSPAEQSRAIQKSLEHKFGEGKKPSATAESKTSPLDPYGTSKFTPEQKAEWAKAQQEHESALRHADSWKPYDAQQADKMRKAAGMRFAAEKRRISGKLTTKEASNKAKYEASFHRGKKVTVRGQSGEVVGMSFGKVRIRMADGKVISANQEDVEDFKP